MNFTDTHQHLIYRDLHDYGWTADIDDLATGDFTLADYRAAVADDAVARTLFMETAVDDADFKAEARFAATLARDASNAMAGVISSCRPEVDDGFEAWLDECEGLGVLGFRRILHVMPDSLSENHVFRRNVRRIGHHGRTFDLCVLQRQLPVGRALAESCPDTQFILDHCGVPDIASGDIENWKEGVSALAALPNVSCKMSGLLAYCSEDDRTLDAVRPYFDYALDIFGAERLVWGGDWPVVTLGGGLANWIAVSQELLSALSEDEAAAIGYRNADRIYGISN